VLKFQILKKDGKARRGKLTTTRGVVDTPVFMPVGTQGTVKAMIHRLLVEMGAQIILGNTYHLYLRPGIEVIKGAGGLHSFISWDRPILTDSGGGVEFRDHLAGDLHFFTPEKVIQIQEVFGSDIIMPLDECVEYPVDKDYAKKSLERTMSWLERSIKAKRRVDQALFGIVHSPRTDRGT